MAKLIEIKYTILRAMSSSEAQITINKCLNKHDLVVITGCPLIINGSGVIKLITDNLMSTDALANVDETLGTVTVARKANSEYQAIIKAQERVKKENFTDITKLEDPSKSTKLEHTSWKCVSTKGKSNGYQNLTVIKYNAKDIEQKREIDQAYPLLSTYVNPSISQIGLYQHPHVDSQLKFVGKSFSKKGCVIACYATVSNKSLSDKTHAEEVIDNLISEKLIDSHGNTKLEAVHYLSKDLALNYRRNLFASSKILRDDEGNWFLGRPGTTGLVNFIASTIYSYAKNHNPSFELCQDIAYAIETLIAFLAPYIYKNTSNSKIFNENVEIQLYANSKYKITYPLSAATFKDIKNLIIECLKAGIKENNGQTEFIKLVVTEAMNSEGQVDTDKIAKVLSLIDLLKTIFLKMGQTKKYTLIEQTNPKGMHLVVAFHNIILGRIVTFDPRWSTCNAGVFLASDGDVIVAKDFLLSTPEYNKQLAFTNSINVSERGVYKYHNYDKNLIQTLKTCEQILKNKKNILAEGLPSHLVTMFELVRGWYPDTILHNEKHITSEYSKVNPGASPEMEKIIAWYEENSIPFGDETPPDSGV